MFETELLVVGVLMELMSVQDWKRHVRVHMHDRKLHSCMQERGEVKREMLFVLCKLLNGMCQKHTLGVRGSVGTRETWSLNPLISLEWFSLKCCFPFAFSFSQWSLPSHYFPFRKHCDKWFSLIASQKSWKCPPFLLVGLLIRSFLCLIWLSLRWSFKALPFR